MTATQITDFVRLWQTSLWQWRSEFLRCNPPDVTGPVLKALKIGSAVGLVEAMKATNADQA